MKPNITTLKERMRIAFRALNDSGAFFKGFGSHLTHLKIHFLNVIPRNIIAPQAVLLFDGFLAFISLFIAIYLRVGDEFLDYTPYFILKNMFVFALTSLSVFIWMQTHRSIWRYFSLEDAIPLGLAVCLSTVLFFPLMILIAQQESLPRSVPFLNASIYMLLLCLPRFIYRYVHDQHARQKQRVLSDQAVPVLLAGSSESTELFILKIIHSPALSYHPLAILSPSNAEKGRTVHSVPIIGTPFQWKKAVKKLDGYDKKPTAIIITDHLVSDAFLEAISYIAQTENYALMKMIPNFTVMPTQTDGAPATVISSSIKA